MTGRPELKPCPFPKCGGGYKTLRYFAGHYHVGCEGCGARGPLKETPEAAVEAWNTRVAEPETCEWTLDDSGYRYDTSCHSAYNTPSDNGYNYCPRCGKRIVLARA